MTEQDFIPKVYAQDIAAGEVKWQAPSNIALVKYWGKRKNQIPANPSLSFTLSSCATTTALAFQKKQQLSADFNFELFFGGEKKKSFRPKVQQFFERIAVYVPFLKDFSLKIHTSNSFPHSSGIASSASGMAALALCVMDMERQLNPKMTPEYFSKKASFLARLGSGSASRSIEGELVVWGAHENMKGSTNLFGIKYPYRVHENFRNYQDTILLVDKGEKQVGSTLGHNLMENHPFAAQRFEQAHQNLDKLKKILESGDLTAFIEVVESEALSLHAMMMTSQPYFLLMQPNTLHIIHKIFDFREATGLHPCFTLDAGANVHVLYPKKEKEEIQKFIQDELTGFCEDGQFIEDWSGGGARKIG